MKKLAFPLLLAVAAALWASQKPDGLDRIAETLGFAGREHHHFSVLSGYSFRLSGRPLLSSLLAAVTGVLLVYACFLAWSYALKKKQNPQN